MKPSLVKKGPKTREKTEPRGEVNIGQRHALVLQAWEAINSERGLQRVLAAVAEVLFPVVPFFGVAIIVIKGRKGAPFAMHIVDTPGCDGETLRDLHGRARAQTGTEAPATEKKLIPYEALEFDNVFEKGDPYVCDDIRKKDEWWPWEFKLNAAGIRAYTSIPLTSRGSPIGVLVFSRREPISFTPEEMTILTDVSRAIAVAVANALANEEIARLRDQLEAENIALRDQLSRVTKFEEIVGDSPSLRRALEAVEQVAATDATVLISGETGTGKELIARAIHQRSHRA